MKGINKGQDTICKEAGEKGKTFETAKFPNDCK